MEETGSQGRREKGLGTGVKRNGTWSRRGNRKSRETGKGVQEPRVKGSRLGSKGMELGDEEEKCGSQGRQGKGSRKINQGEGSRSKLIGKQESKGNP